MILNIDVFIKLCSIILLKYISNNVWLYTWYIWIYYFGQLMRFAYHDIKY